MASKIGICKIVIVKSVRDLLGLWGAAVDVILHLAISSASNDSVGRSSSSWHQSILLAALLFCLSPSRSPEWTTGRSSRFMRLIFVSYENAICIISEFRLCNVLLDVISFSQFIFIFTNQSFNCYKYISMNSICEWNNVTFFFFSRSKKKKKNLLFQWQHNLCSFGWKMDWPDFRQ